MTVLLTLVRNLDPKIAYGILSAIVALTALCALLMVREPSDVKPEKPNFKKLCKLVKKGCTKIFTVWEIFINFINVVLIG